MTNLTYYRYFQPNPDIVNDKGDCAIRALCAATDEDWLSVFDDLVVLARKHYTILNDMDVLAEYLEARGFTPCKVSVKKGTKRPTMRDLIRKYPGYIIVGRCSKHIMCATKGKVKDSWDSSLRPLYKYWIKPETL